MKPRYLPYWLTAISMACALMGGCTTCRETALRDATTYSAQGYETKICSYDLLMDGLIWGGGMWPRHAQACIRRDDGTMSYVGMLGLSDEPTFRLGRQLVIWDVDEFKQVVVEPEKSNSRYWWLLLLLLI